MSVFVGIVCCFLFIASLIYMLINHRSKETGLGNVKMKEFSINEINIQRKRRKENMCLTTIITV